MGVAPFAAAENRLGACLLLSVSNLAFLCRKPSSTVFGVWGHREAGEVQLC